MKYFLFLITFMAIAFETSTAQPILSLSGSALSGISSFDQAALLEKNRQFESAANLVLTADISDQLSTNLEFGLGVEGLSNSSSFSSGVSLAAYDITYQTNYYDSSISLGALTIPYGQFAYNQTYNSSINSPFIYNDLGYSLLSRNSLVDFASIGMGTRSVFDFGTIKTFIFNGTDARAANEDEGFGVSVSYETGSLINGKVYDKPFNLNLGASILNVNDKGINDNQNEEIGIDANISGLILDAKFSADFIEFGGYVSIMNFDDSNSSTADEVNTYMLYTSKNFGNVLLSARYSLITPKDYNGNGSGVTSAIDNVGLTNNALLTVTDIETTRYQISAIVNIEENFNIHNEVILDTYEDVRYDTAAVISYASLSF